MQARRCEGAPVTLLALAGRTVDGRAVVSGVYRVHETSGVPLDVILESVRERGMLVDWQSFVREAVAAGMSRERAISKLEAAIVDSFGPEMARVVVARLG